MAERDAKKDEERAAIEWLRKAVAKRETAIQQEALERVALGNALLRLINRRDHLRGEQ